MRILIWTDETPEEKIDEISRQAFADIMENYAPTIFRPSFTRIAGQSGSGKSTQVLPAILSTDKTSVVIAVQKFVKYWEGKPNAPREQTNGFCLRVLTNVLYKLINAKVNIILDMTLLSVKYEKQLLKRLQAQNYYLKYFILAVPKKQSDIFIKKRERETGRAVSPGSAAFFNKVLPGSLCYIAERCPAADCVVWSAYDLDPIYHGKLGEVPPVFTKARKIIKPLTYTIEELLDAKIKFLVSYNPYN